MKLFLIRIVIKFSKNPNLFIDPFRYPSAYRFQQKGSYEFMQSISALDSFYAEIKNLIIRLKGYVGKL